MRSKSDVSRPSDAWDLQVRKYRDQFEQVRSRLGDIESESSNDIGPWLKMNLSRKAPDLLDRVLSEVDGNSTVLDVGGGAGRFAVPIANNVDHVTVVEPSSAMIQALRNRISDEKVQNISVVEDDWLSANTGTYDLVLSTFVLHETDSVEQFIRKLENSAANTVMILEHEQSPYMLLAGLWKIVHGTSMLATPGANELSSVLSSLGIKFEFEWLPPLPQPALKTHDEAVELIRQMLLVPADSLEHERLKTACDEWVEETPSGYSVRGATPSRRAVFTWHP